MDSQILTNIHWLQILVAAIAYFALGAIWYSALFGKKWVAYQKIDMNDPNAKSGTGAIMFGSFIWMFITCIALDIIVTRLGLSTAMSGIKWGLLTGICFSAAAISISYLYVKKPTGLHLIDCLYHVVGQVVACVILCIWE
ncbi:MAG: DUF1761 domain-containing protein [Flavisolibacter sp.]